MIHSKISPETTSEFKRYLSGISARDFFKILFWSFFRNFLKSFYKNLSEIFPSISLKLLQKFLQRFLKIFLQAFYLEIATAVLSEITPVIQSEIHAGNPSDIPPGSFFQKLKKNNKKSTGRIVEKAPQGISKEISRKLHQEKP